MIGEYNRIKLTTTEKHIKIPTMTNGHFMFIFRISFFIIFIVNVNSIKVHTSSILEWIELNGNILLNSPENNIKYIWMYISLFIVFLLITIIYLSPIVTLSIFWLTHVSSETCLIHFLCKEVHTVAYRPSFSLTLISF